MLSVSPDIKFNMHLLTINNGSIFESFIHYIEAVAIEDLRRLEPSQKPQPEKKYNTED